MAITLAAPALACERPVSVCGEARGGALRLIANGAPVSVLSDPRDDPAARSAAASLQADLERVAGHSPGMADSAIIVGTIGHSEAIDRMIAAGKLDISGVTGRWEAYVMQVVDRPGPGLDHALVIAGADRRGTAFGAYDLSQAIGVSPWSWWADVPVPHRADLYLTAGRRVEAPTVKYRGIFINDEDPALAGWAKARFGGLNAKFYERVFDLILRLRGNLLWPAMWGKSFFEDDPANAKLAQAMGVIVGTSHHEPLMRAHVDWEHHGSGPWDYTKNAERLRAFWREGVERTQGQDRIVTVGMRGDGDEPMAKGTATQLLESIVADQRKIIGEVTGRPPLETPQVWALYKEVQDYYDAGMRVPGDVTLLFSDDNWGNIRRLPQPGATRAGGYGVYYHFDYVGGPRNYKWIDTNPIQRVWQQMKLARDSGADRLWIVNVGDIKPMEFPTSFFLDMAWDPDGMTLARMDGYAAQWAGEQFGPARTAEIGSLLTRYGVLISRRKPELLDAATYDLAGGEWDRVMGEWAQLRADAERIEAAIPAAGRDAYFELILHRILAAENLHRLYYAVALNHSYADAGDGRANAAAGAAEAAFSRDAELRRRYEVETAGGKWTQMMAQTHIGYTSWQQPPRDVRPEVTFVSAPMKGDVMPDVKRVSVPTGGSEKRAGGNSGFVGPILRAPGNPLAPRFGEQNGLIAIEAEHHVETPVYGNAEWRTIPNLGRTLSGVAYFPQNVAPIEQPGGDSPHLVYRVKLDRAGPIDLKVLASPGLDVRGNGLQRYAISVDNAPARIVNLLDGENEARWGRAVAENIRIGTTRFDLAPGWHKVCLWLVDPELVFQRVLLVRPGVKTGYLGPPESVRK